MSNRKAMMGTRMRNGSYYFSLPGFVCADFYDAVQTVDYTNSQCQNITYVRPSCFFKNLAYNFLSVENFRIHYFRVKFFFDHGYDVSRTQRFRKRPMLFVVPCCDERSYSVCVWGVIYNGCIP